MDVGGREYSHVGSADRDPRGGIPSAFARTPDPWLLLTSKAVLSHDPGPAWSVSFHPCTVFLAGLAVHLIGVQFHAVWGELMFPASPSHGPLEMPPR